MYLQMRRSDLSISDTPGYRGAGGVIIIIISLIVVRVKEVRCRQKVAGRATERWSREVT
jgi:hypothetical protein